MLQKKSASAADQAATTTVAAMLSDEEVALWSAYESARDVPTRNAIAEFYRPQVEKLAYYIISRRKLPVTQADVMGAVWERMLHVVIPR